ncbi:MAG: T9SS type A sorting domain-containing protein, partial [Bacteroidetes bacterium]|nr:T9SS type A sorting domain-containing protein [Bacteroidota bacterium]
FTPSDWNQAQTVTLTASEDNDFQDDVETLTLMASGGGYAGVPAGITVTITDNDEADLVVPASVTVPEGDTQTFEVSLSGAPSSDVTVTISGHAGTDLAGTPPAPLSLTFTPVNYGAGQTVTLTAAADDDLANDAVTLTLTASGGEYAGVTAEVAVTIMDNMGLDTEETETPLSVALWGNYPNPLSNTTKIAFDLPAPAIISVTITDLLGRTVKMLPYGSFGVGKGHTVEIDAEDLPSGVYYYTLKVVMDDQVAKRSKAMSVVR